LWSAAGGSGRAGPRDRGATTAAESTDGGNDVRQPPAALRPHGRPDKPGPREGRARQRQAAAERQGARD